jgi:hypothetical protein
LNSDPVQMSAGTLPKKRQSTTPWKQVVLFSRRSLSAVATMLKLSSHHARAELRHVDFADQLECSRICAAPKELVRCECSSGANCISRLTHRCSGPVGPDFNFQTANRRMGRAKRNPSRWSERHDDGFRCALPILRLIQTTDMSSRSRGMKCPSFAFRFALSSDRGCRESRVLVAPVGPVQQKARGRTTGSTGAFRLSLRDGVTAYFVLSPVTGLFCHRHP